VVNIVRPHYSSGRRHSKAGSRDGPGRRPVASPILIGMRAAFYFHAVVKRQALRWVRAGWSERFV
jgi:hypothetical protein